MQVSCHLLRRDGVRFGRICSILSGVLTVLAQNGWLKI